jgi:hypothetical protein
VLLEHFQPKRELTKKEERAIEALMRLIEDIEDVKSRAARAAGR